MLSTIRKLCDDEGGATAVEYALMLAAIAAVIISVVFAVGVRTSAAFADMDTKLAAH